MLLATYSIWRRDIVRFFRQRSRVVGALGTPVIFWALLGSGLGSSFEAATGSGTDAGYLEYFYPGTLALILLFTAIFSTISVIEDRHEGFLQGVLVAPPARLAIVLGKLLGGTTIAVAQALLFLTLAPLARAHVAWATLPLIVVVLALLAFALTGLGFVLAWLLDSTQGFHAIMNVLLLPMWLLSGAVFPADGAAAWIRGIILINPMTYGVTALRAVLSDPAAAGEAASLAAPLAAVAAFGALTLAASSWSVYARRG